MVLAKHELTEYTMEEFVGILNLMIDMEVPADYVFGFLFIQNLFFDKDFSYINMNYHFK